MSLTGAGRPVPTPLCAALLGAAVLPAILGIVSPMLFGVSALLDAAILLLAIVDFVLAPDVRALTVERRVEPILSSGVPNPVRLRLDARRPLHLVVRDVPIADAEVEGHVRQVTLDSGSTELRYAVTPRSRGDRTFGDLHVRFAGPLRLCSRQQRVPLEQRVKVYPDLSALTNDALSLALGCAEAGRRARLNRAEGTELASLREYRAGDDLRDVDWKASARRGRTIVRERQPEQHQPVMLLIDCGRHMAGELGARRKIDHAVDAALRLAAVSLSRGDLVGVMAFGRQPLSFMAPARGRDQLRRLTEALYLVEARLEESDYSAAIDLAFSRLHRRTLAVVFTDLLDPNAAEPLVVRAAKLRPRHLPFIASLRDPIVLETVHALPRGPAQVFERLAAIELDRDLQRTVAELRRAGALVVHQPAQTFSAAAVNAYLELKARGQL